jgi:hypothetical protein
VALPGLSWGSGYRGSLPLERKLSSSRSPAPNGQAPGPPASPSDRTRSNMQDRKTDLTTSERSNLTLPSPDQTIAPPVTRVSNGDNEL